MILEYIARDWLVQIAFIVAIGLGFVSTLINRRTMKSQEYEREEKKEARRERFMALPPSKRKVEDIEAE